MYHSYYAYRGKKPNRNYIKIVKKLKENQKVLGEGGKKVFSALKNGFIATFPLLIQ